MPLDPAPGGRPPETGPAMSPAGKGGHPAAPEKPAIRTNIKLNARFRELPNATFIRGEAVDVHTLEEAKQQWQSAADMMPQRTHRSSAPRWLAGSRSESLRMAVAIATRACAVPGGLAVRLVEGARCRRAERSCCACRRASGG